MLRDGTKCVFDPQVFIKSLGDQHNPMIRYVIQKYEQYIWGDFTQLYADKTWVDVCYKLETSFDIRLEMTSPQDGPCVIRMSQVAMTGTMLADIMYDKFGMIPVSKLDPFNNTPSPSGGLPFNTRDWLFGKIWTVYMHKNLDLFTRMIEDPFLEFTAKELHEFLNASINDNWTEATMVLMRAIHDIDDGTDTAEKTLRL